MWSSSEESDSKYWENEAWAPLEELSDFDQHAEVTKRAWGEGKPKKELYTYSTLEFDSGMWMQT